MTTRSTLTIPEAADVFGIHGRASLNGLHTRFRELVKVWHPDVSQHDPGLSHDGSTGAGVWIHIKPMQNHLFSHLVMRSTVNRPAGMMTSVLLETNSLQSARSG